MDFYRYHRRLPHWRAHGCTYFLTWRLHKTQLPLMPLERSTVFDCIRHFDGQRFVLGAHVVMDDHVHAVVTPAEGHPLTSICHTWKSFTAGKLRNEYGRQGRIWQEETFDRIVRDGEELHRFREYITGNPLRRWPDGKGYPWVAPAGPASA